jgi:predicted DNA-binding transcriptional regulator AlpA
MLQVSEDTLREWRRLKTGPDFVKVGKAVLYRETDVQKWIEMNVVPTTRSRVDR